MISIVIPTFNRPVYLRRILGYYNSFYEKFDTIVADSSSDVNKKTNKEIITAFPDLKILYLDSYPETLNPWFKYTDAIEHVRSKYCVLCADDDFITPGGIKESVEFLEANQDYILAQGRGIGFTVENGKRNKQKFHWKYAYSLVSVEFTDPASRLEFHLSNYLITTIYGVHSSDALKMVYNEVLKSEVDLILFGELLATALTILYGKLKCLDVLYSARNAEPVLESHGPNIRDSIEAGTFNEKYARFKECLSAHLIEKSRLSPKESGDLVDKAMSAYLNKHMLKPVVPVPKTKKRALLDSLHLPPRIHDGIVASYAMLNKIITIKTKSLYDALLGKPIFSSIKNRDDFTKIRFHVLSQPGTIIGKPVK